MLHAGFPACANAPRFHGKAQREEREEAAAYLQPQNMAGLHHGTRDGFAQAPRAFTGGAAYFARVAARICRSRRRWRLRVALFCALLRHAPQHLDSRAQLAACAFVIHPES